MARLAVCSGARTAAQTRQASACSRAERSHSRGTLGRGIYAACVYLVFRAAAAGCGAPGAGPVACAGPAPAGCWCHRGGVGRFYRSQLRRSPLLYARFLAACSSLRVFLWVSLSVTRRDSHGSPTSKLCRCPTHGNSDHGRTKIRRGRRGRGAQCIVGYARHRARRHHHERGRPPSQ